MAQRGQYADVHQRSSVCTPAAGDREERNRVSSLVDRSDQASVQQCQMYMYSIDLPSLGDVGSSSHPARVDAEGRPLTRATLP